MKNEYGKELLPMNEDLMKYIKYLYLDVEKIPSTMCEKT